MYGNTKEISLIAPKYKGKPENYDPAKVGKPKTKEDAPAQRMTQYQEDHM